MAASTEEKQLLRTAAIARKATEEETEAWLAASASHLSEKARTAFHCMSAEQQYRVMYEGPIFDCQDATEVLYGRIQRFMDMESTLKRLSNTDDGVSKEKKADKKASSIAVAIGKALVAQVEFKEVPEDERRHAAPAGAPASVGATEPEKPAKPSAPQAGRVKGIGGVIEALQKKYNMVKGERAKVVGESKELWKLTEERNVPKTHCGQGWRWVLVGAELSASLKAKDVDHYGVLGISKNASPDEVKKAYRTLSKLYHPDKAGPNLDEAAKREREQQMMLLNVAYQATKPRGPSPATEEKGGEKKGAGLGTESRAKSSPCASESSRSRSESRPRKKKSKSRKSSSRRTSEKGKPVARSKGRRQSSCTPSRSRSHSKRRRRKRSESTRSQSCSRSRYDSGRKRGSDSRPRKSRRR